MKIAIFGMGGVGGFYGGKLAAYCSGKNQHQIIFIARGKHLEEMRKDGLKVKQGADEKIIHPDFCTDDCSSIGKVDVLLLSVKTYSLEEIITSIQSIISTETIVIPLMNGIEPYEFLKTKFPSSQIFQGCCYLNAFIESPGVLNVRGNFDQLLFGFQNKEKRKLISDLFSAAGINILEADDISIQVWEKFIFASSLSSIGSLENESFGEIIASEERKKLLTNLIDECLDVARAKGIAIENNFIEKMIDKVAGYPFEARTSMQLDFVKGHKTELETFTGYVVKKGVQLGVDVSNYKNVYEMLLKK